MATRQIAWPRIFAEGVAIVVSILLAFGIQAWWEGRQDRAEALKLLEGLEAEFVGLTSRLSATAARYEATTSHMEWLLDVAAEGESLSIARVDSALVGMVWPTTFDPGSGVRDALLASGQLELLQGEELKSRLASWQAVLDEARDNEEAMRVFVLQVSVPFLASRGIRTGRPVGASGSSSRFPPAPLLEPLVDSVAVARRYQSLIDDPEFISLVEYRYVWAALSAIEFDNASAAAGEIMRLIRDELGS